MLKRLSRWIHRPWPRHDGARQPGPLFIVGSGRSGNTLLRRLLMQGGKFHIPPESYVLGPICRIHSLTRFLPWDDYVRYVLGRFEFHPEFVHFDISLRDVVPDLLSTKMGSRSLRRVIETIYIHHMRVQRGRDDLLWGDKTPLNTAYLPWISKTFPDATYVEMVRDGIDVIESYMRIGRYTSALEASLRWASALEAVEDLRQSHRPRVLRIHYEDLVEDPTREIERLADFLDLPHLSFEPDSSTIPLGDTVLPHHQNIHRAIHTSNIGRGRRELPTSTLERIAPLVNPILQRLGYASATGPEA